MATLVGIQRDVLGLLDALIELDCDCIEAHRVAIDRLECDTFRDSFSTFLEDHQRHVQDLTQLVRSLGGSPPDALGSECRHILAQGKTVLSHMLGGDRAILTAMLANMEDATVAYERTVGRRDVPPDVQLLAARHLADERAHRSWVVLRLQELEGAVGVDSETVQH